MLRFGTLCATLATLSLAPLSFAAAPAQVGPRAPQNPKTQSGVTPGCVTSIAELLALAPPVPLLGVGCVRVLGFHLPGDGGGGLFYWDPSAATAVDEGLVFESTHPAAPTDGRWTRIFSGPLRASFWDLKGDGTDETSTLQAVLNAGQGRELAFDRPGIFGFSEPLTIPPDCKLTTHDATFMVLGAPAGAIPAITVGARVTADAIRVHVAAQVQVRRLIMLLDGDDIAKIVLSSTDLQTTFVPNLDGALQVRGNNIHIGEATLSDFERSVMCYSSDHVVIDRLRITDYIAGIRIRESSFVHLLSARITEPSPNATTVKGHNGVLIEASTDVHVSNVTIHDSGEHAVRVGGLPSERLVFSNIQAIRPGQCGFKINPSANTLVRDVQISGLTVVDASATSLTGSNEDGLRLEKCAHVVVDGFQVQRRDGSDSCNVGIYINSSTNVTINGPKITDTASHGIHLQDLESRVNEIYINNPSILVTGEHGIFIESPVEVLRDITVMDAFIRGQAGWGILLHANSPTVGVNQPVILDGWVKNDGLGGFALSTTDADVHVSVTVVN